MQDAADRKRLHATTFKSLNVGVGALATAQAALLATAVKGGFAASTNITFATIGAVSLLAATSIYNISKVKKDAKISRTTCTLTFESMK